MTRPIKLTVHALQADGVCSLSGKAGVVQTRELPEKMGDGNPDYEITLTAKGRKFLASR